MKSEEDRRVAEGRQREAAEPLVDFIPRISPRYLRPFHLQPLLDALTLSETQAVRAIVNIPPRHSKTETILHYIAWRLKRRPWDTIAYVTYGADLTNSKSRLAREYAVRAGVQMRDDANALHEWRTTDLGGALFTSIGGAITGQGANVLIIDDPHKDRSDAESVVMRNRVWDWYVGTGLDRVEPGGSVIICQTRWHPEDMTGRALKEMPEDNWDQISLPALGRDVAGKRIADLNGEPLWPERWPKHELLAKKRNDYEWESKFQQNPRKRGGSVFKSVRYYDPRQLPGGLRVSIGIDLAYTAKTSADHSAIVVLGEMNGLIFVLYAQREQMEVDMFAPIIAATAHIYPGVKVHWHTSTTEQGTAQLLRAMGIPVRHQLAKADKFIRSLPVAAKWNAGHILVPGGLDEFGNPVEVPDWVNSYVTEMCGFTGVGDLEDDQVDATSSAYGPWAGFTGGRTDSGDEDFSFGD